MNNEKNAKISADLSMEPYQILTTWPYLPNTLRITYTKKKGGTICQIEEIDGAESVITSCTFRGRSATGDCPQDIKDFKPLFNTLKTSDWKQNDGYLDEFYKNY